MSHALRTLAMRPLSLHMASRSLSTSVALRAEPSGKVEQTFSSREKSQEEMYVQQKEREAFQRNKAELEKQRKKLIEQGHSEAELDQADAGKK